MHITVDGQSMRLIGLPLKVGDRARDVRVSDANLSLVLPLARSQGNVRLFLTVPSLDIPVFGSTVKHFSDRLDSLPPVAAFLISADLPFAQVRWQQDAKVTNMTLLSDYRDMDFARNWGLLIQPWGLLTQAVYVVDRAGIVTYREIVPDLTSSPNHAAAMTALKALA
ncbi:redoxin domain-containing protein [Pseudanabaenaceae cyanobacterium LEGE 13415]|nr:redoxin domain-containing protein [Pseudanabaenaceae cyanobacterium LEGE 13415]